MRSYGQFCPVAKTAEILCQRWNALIIRDLSWGSSRFSELRRGVPLMSPTLLAQRLRELEAEGVIERRPLQRGRGHSYHLTPAGAEFAPIIEAMGVWGRRWTRRALAPNEIDMDLLLWGLETQARYDAFGRVPTVVQIDFPDQPAHKRHWWFLNDQGRSQLCIDDPGRDVDLYLAAPVEEMIHLYLGDTTVAVALQAGRVEAIASTEDRRRIQDWINPGPWSEIAPAR